MAVEPRFTLRFVVFGETKAEVDERVEKHLDSFAPKSRWNASIDVEQVDIVRTGTGEIVSWHHQADVTAQYLGPE